MKNNIWMCKIYLLPIIFLMVLMVGCKKNQFAFTGEFRNYDEKLSQLQSQNSNQTQIPNPNPPHRELATSEVINSCLTDELTEARLLGEIRNLEKNHPATKNSSRTIWNGLDLSRFSNGQATFIEKSLNWIHDANFSGQNCADVKCVYQSIYPNSTGIEGLLTYYFYLRTGVVLSTKKSIPDINLNSFAFTDTLFSRKELGEFFVLAKTLTPPFFNMRTLNAIHRYPRNRLLPAAIGVDSNSCGLAGGTTESGYIILLDACLNQNPNTPYNLVFLQSVAHEFTHRLDWVLKRGAKRFSETDLWLDFSGWYIKEAIDPGTGRASRQWDNKQSIGEVKYDLFVRPYANTSPVEDFADTVAYTRFEPEETLNKSPKKFAWISKNLFNDRIFTVNGLGQTYAQIVKSKVMTELLAIVSRCVANPKQSTYTGDLPLATDFAEHDPELVKCVFGELSGLVGIEMKSLQYDELEACNYLKTSSAAVQRRVMEDMAYAVKKDLQSNITVANQLKAAGELIVRLKEEVDPRELFISCLEGQSPQNCYSTSLNEIFEKLGADYQEKIPYQLETVKTDFLKQNDFLTVSEKLKSLFGQIYGGSDIKLKDEAVRKWQYCFVEKNYQKEEVASDILLLSPFHGETQYIHRLLLNCLNNKASEELYGILAKAAKKLGITISNPGTHKFILDMYVSSYLSYFQVKVKEGAKNENAHLATLNVFVAKNAFEDLVKSPHWVGPAYIFSQELHDTCENEAKIRMASESKKFAEENGLTFMFTESTAFGKASEVCQNVLNSHSIRALVKENETTKINTALANLKTVMVDRSAESVKLCKLNLKDKDKDKVSSNKWAKSCVTKSEVWHGLVANGLQSWLVQEKLESVGPAKKAGEDYLRKIKEELQNTIVSQLADD